MATFIKLANNSEYQISDDGRYLMHKHVPSGADHWVNQCVIPNGLRVLDMRSSRSGVNVELLLSDNRWYQISSSHGGLTLTTEELEKSRRSQNAQEVDKKSRGKEAAYSEKGENTQTKRKSGINEVLGHLKTSVHNFRRIEDSSDFEEGSNQIVNDYINDINNQFANAQKDVDEAINRHNDIYRRRDKEIERLRKAKEVIVGRVNKSLFFVNLGIYLNEYAIEFTSSDTVVSYLNPKTKKAENSITDAFEAYKKSLLELGASEQFKNRWLDIFYLIVEGINFTSDQINFIVKLIHKEFGGSNTEGLQEDDDMDGFLDYCYDKFPLSLYRGYDFASRPKDDAILERLEFLEKEFLLDPDSYRDSFLGFAYSNSRYSKTQDDLDANGSSDNNVNCTEDNRVQNLNVDNDETIQKGDDLRQEVKGVTEKKKFSKPSNSPLFPDLMETFKKEKLIDESIKPKGFFDFSTKNRNRKVNSLKEKRRDTQEEIDNGKKDIRKGLLSLLKLTEKLINKEKTLAEIRETPIKTNREKERLEDRIERTKDQIESIQDDIQDHNEELKDSWKDLLSNIKKYNMINSELFNLTSSDSYAAEYQIQGPAITIVMSIAQNVKMKDSATLVGLFREYLQ